VRGSGGAGKDWHHGKEEAAWIRAHAAFKKEEVDAIEAVTNHDVIAFLTNMGSYIDADVPEGEPKPSRWVHFGMTSTRPGRHRDVLPAQAGDGDHPRRLQEAGEICKRRAFEEKDTLCVGRTHGIHAEPMTFGMKFGSWAWELKRDYERLADAR
jgi:adenylosuccinate lyase